MGLVLALELSEVKKASKSQICHKALCHRFGAVPQRLRLGAWNDAKLCLHLSPLRGLSHMKNSEKLGRDDLHMSRKDHWTAASWTAFGVPRACEFH